MNTAAPPVASSEEQILLEARGKGGLALVLAYFKLSGPGWLQSALTLGGGSLSSSLYLGVLAGTSLLWLQPVAMVLGIVMLSAIGYVTTSTGASPFQAVNRQVNPVLGWGWALASLLASLVWSMPQYSLATAVVQQNLLPGVVEGWPGKVGVVLLILGVSTAVTWSYGRDRMGVKFYEVILKIAGGPDRGLFHRGGDHPGPFFPGIALAVAVEGVHPQSAIASQSLGTISPAA